MLPEREKRDKEGGKLRETQREGGERGLTEDEGVRSCVVMNPLNATSL